MGVGTRQPSWTCIANMGDVHPIDHGGLFVYRDKTGVYTEEAELLEVPNDESGVYTVYRFSLDKCTYIDGILSDNKFHPEHPAWFAHPEAARKERPQDTTYLSNIITYCGGEVEDMVEAFCSDDPLRRADAYRAVGVYHGFDNLDMYPLTLSRSEVKKRYRTTIAQLKRLGVQHGS